jgi:hypothetical protein
MCRCDTGAVRALRRFRSLAVQAWRLRNALPPRFVLSGSAVVPVTTHFIGLGSITVQCRQQVNTPC